MIDQYKITEGIVITLDALDVLFWVIRFGIWIINCGKVEYYLEGWFRYVFYGNAITFSVSLTMCTMNSIFLIGLLSYWVASILP